MEFLNIEAIPHRPSAWRQCFLHSMKDEGWRMKDEGWRIQDEGWRMKDEGWRMKDEETGWDPSWRLLGFWVTQNSQFSIGFIRFCDMADHHVIYSEKPCRFWMILEAICAVGLKNHPFSIGFIRYFDRLFQKPGNWETLPEFCIFEESSFGIDV